MGIKHLLVWFSYILTRFYSKTIMKQQLTSSDSEYTSGQGLESDTELKSSSVRFLLFVSQSILFETGGDKSGAYTNDPDDSGGETKWGISKRAHSHLNIKAITYNQAVEIYRTQYWNELYDYILCTMCAFKLFDLGILTGTKSAVRLLQKSVKRCGFHIRVDGVFGPLTLTAINNIKPEQLYEVYIKTFDTWFRRLVIRVVKNRKYLNGWLNRLRWKFTTEKGVNK